MKVDKYKWLCEQYHDGTLLRVNSTAGYTIDIQTFYFDNGRIIVNDQFDITNIWVYGFNPKYQTMDYRYPQWEDRYYYYTDVQNEWRAIRHG